MIDAGGGYVLPGLIQTHIHLCQTLFRGSADDLPLLEWLRRRVWPMEAAHNPASLRAAARLAALELLTSGTTAVLTMETVHDTDAVFEAVAETGLRATIGKAMMDSAPEAPRRLRETPARRSTRASRLPGGGRARLKVGCARRWRRASRSPARRSCCDPSRRCRTSAACWCTRTRPNRAMRWRSSAAVRDSDNLEYLSHVRLAGPRLCAAHCVWVDEHEMALLAEHGVKVLHCPSSNLKLGSGIAPVADMRERGISVSLGADGAACNNRLDMFEEMRLAALLQAVAERARRAARPGCAVDGDARRSAGARPRGGARLDRARQTRGPHHRRPRSAALLPGDDPCSTMVYAARGSDVTTTIVDGAILVEDGNRCTWTRGKF